jgi:hypothetical protein
MRRHHRVGPQRRALHFIALVFAMFSRRLTSRQYASSEVHSMDPLTLVQVTEHFRNAVSQEVEAGLRASNAESCTPIGASLARTQPRTQPCSHRHRKMPFCIRCLFSRTRGCPNCSGLSSTRKRGVSHSSPATNDNCMSFLSQGNTHAQELNLALLFPVNMPSTGNAHLQFFSAVKPDDLPVQPQWLLLMLYLPFPYLNEK